MRIVRIDFLGFTVTGPERRKVMSCFALSGVNAWGKDWHATAEGQELILEGEGRRLELPRSKCVVEWGPDAIHAEATAAMPQFKRGPGRPPKLQPAQEPSQ
jgi:hypothetical protein